MIVRCFSDIIKNTYLKYRNILYKNILQINFGNYKINYNQYDLVLFDEFNKQNINLWNTINKDKSNPRCVEFTPTGLILHQENDNIGHIESINPFNTGIYEFNVELPITYYANPKIELISTTNLQKITILDGISDVTGKYVGLYNNVKIGHIGLNQRNIGKHQMLKLNMPEINYYYINLKLLYEKNKIIFYMNNYKVREITNMSILKYINKHQFKINIKNNTLKAVNNKSKFIIKNFSYYKRK